MSNTVTRPYIFVITEINEVPGTIQIKRTEKNYEMDQQHSVYGGN